MLQHDDLVAHQVHHREVVADEEVGHAEAVLQFLQQVEHLCLHRHVERAHRFVGHDQLRPRDEGARDGDALALAAGKFVGILAHKRPRQAHVVHQSQYACSNSTATFNAV